MLYAYCAERGVDQRRCGKLIVANTASQAAALPAIVDKARANGVDDLVLLTSEEARTMEPQLACLAAVHSPSTGIVDSHALMLSLQGDLENAGGMVACHSGVERLRAVDGGMELYAEDGTALLARTVVNAAGLHACALARRTEGLHPRHVPQPCYAKGSYFTLSGRSPFEQLIYPAPEPDKHLAGLGVHLTIDLGGQAKFGPDVQWVDDPDRSAGGSGARRGFLRRGAEVLAKPGRWCAAAGLRRHAAQDQRSARAGGGFPHRRPGGARCARTGQPVRHRVTRPDQLPGHRRATWPGC